MFDSSSDKAQGELLPARLFDVTRTMFWPTSEAWDQVWSFSDNIWTSLGGRSYRADGSWRQTFGCRLNTVAKQGKVKAAEITPLLDASSSSSTKKRRVSHFTESIDCKAKIIVERNVDGSVKVSPNDHLLNPCENAHSLHDVNDSAGQTVTNGVRWPGSDGDRGTW